MNRTTSLLSCQRWIGVLLVVLVALLSACNPNYRGNDKPVLHTTISADGQMVASLLHAGTKQQLLRVRNLNTDNSWRTVQAPPLTQDIRFGIQGHLLLVSYYRPDAKVNVLGWLNVETPGGLLEAVYEGVELAFPVEVSPGRILARTHHMQNPDTGKKVNAFSYYWILLEAGKLPQRVGPEQMLGTEAPSIVGTGFFFWINFVESNAANEMRRSLRKFPLPGGQLPEIHDVKLNESTTGFICDSSAKRCLRSYISNKDQIPHGSYIYDVAAVFGTTHCQIQSVAGWHDDIFITPDGNAAVMSLASGPDKPRHVVVMHFNPQQCEAISVQHINFEEK